MSDQEKITPVEFPPKPAIYKIETNDSRQYCSEYKGKYMPLDVQEYDLIDYLDMIFDHFYHFSQMFDDYSWGNPFFILEALIKYFKNYIKALDYFIRQEIGNIQVETIDDEIVGVSVKPIDKNK